MELEKIYFERYQKVREQINAAKRSFGILAPEVTLIAVSKGFSINEVEVFYRFGQRDFGENYAQELEEKSKQAQESGLNEIRWHFMGHLQSNKVKQVLPIATYIHSIDSEKILLASLRFLAGKNLSPKLLLQMNLDNSESKYGFSAQSNWLELIHKHPEIHGLMTIPDPGNEFVYQQLSEMVKNLNSPKLLLSMGMSADFEEAIRCGSNMVRVGTALFGNRTYK